MADEPNGKPPELSARTKAEMAEGKRVAAVHAARAAKRAAAEAAASEPVEDKKTLFGKKK